MSRIRVNRTFEVTVPVLVIGGGACGLIAALAAHDAGADDCDAHYDLRRTEAFGVGQPFSDLRDVYRIWIGASSIGRCSTRLKLTSEGVGASVSSLIAQLFIIRSQQV